MVKDFTNEVNLKDRGVYMITHQSTDIKYIGSTITTFQERWRLNLHRGTTSKVFRGLTKVLRKKYIPKLI